MASGLSMAAKATVGASVFRLKDLHSVLANGYNETPHPIVWSLAEKALPHLFLGLSYLCPTLLLLRPFERAIRSVCLLTLLTALLAKIRLHCLALINWGRLRGCVVVQIRMKQGNLGQGVLVEVPFGTTFMLILPVRISLQVGS